MIIIPTINVKTEEDAELVIKKIALVSPTWVQFDVGDGIFSSQKTWSNPTKAIALLSEYIPLAPSEVHIMKRDVEREVYAWIDAGVKRVIVHYETIDIEKMKHIVSYAHGRNVRVMLALLPQTPIEVVRQYPEVNEFQILSVNPGPSGQKFIFEMGEKIKALKQMFPLAYIEVDGGINRSTASFVAKAHPDAIAVGAYLSNSKDIKKDFLLLAQIV